MNVLFSLFSLCAVFHAACTNYAVNCCWVVCVVVVVVVATSRFRSNHRHSTFSRESGPHGRAVVALRLVGLKFDTINELLSVLTVQEMTGCTKERPEPASSCPWFELTRSRPPKQINSTKSGTPSIPSTLFEPEMRRMTAGRCGVIDHFSGDSGIVKEKYTHTYYTCIFAQIRTHPSLRVFAAAGRLSSIASGHLCTYTCVRVGRQDGARMHDACVRGLRRCRGVTWI